MSDITGVIKIHAYDYNPKYGSYVWHYNDVTVTQGYALGESKTSVDTGSFIPGIYRTNAYDIWQEEMSCNSASIQHTSYTDAYQHGIVTHYYSLTGDVMYSYVFGKKNYTIPSTSESLAAQALQKAYANVRQAEIGLGENLGELAQTIAMLKSPLKALRQFLTRNDSRNLRMLRALATGHKTPAEVRKYLKWSGAKHSKVFAQTWLELRYGLRPLVMTLSDAIDMVNSKERLFDPSKIRCSRSHAQDTSFESIPPDIGADAYFVDFDIDYESRVDMKATASVQYKASRPPTTSEKLALSPRYWPETVWELTTLSFVVDWFVSIGPWLGSLRISPEVTILGNTVGIKTVRTITAVGSNLKIGTDPVGGTLEAEWRLERYTRTVGSELPLLPVFTMARKLSLLKAIDAASLIAQRLLR